MHTKTLTLGMAVLACLLAACQPAPAAPTPTAVPESTATPVPEPTATLAPAEPAAAAIGDVLASPNWEVTVLGVQLVGDQLYDQEVNGSVLADEGSSFVALGLKAKPLGDVKAVPYASLMIADENGQPHGAYYSGIQAGDGGELDPFDIDVTRCSMMAIAGGGIDLPAESYLHLVYQIPQSSLGQELTFKFDDSAPVTFTVE